MLAAAKCENPESPTNGKEALLNNVEDFKSSIDLLVNLIAEMKSVNERAETLLQDELRRNEEILQVRDSAIRIRELRDSLDAKTQTLGSQPSKKEQVDPFEILFGKSG